MLVANVIHILNLLPKQQPKDPAKAAVLAKAFEDLKKGLGEFLATTALEKPDLLSEISRAVPKAKIKYTKDEKGIVDAYDAVRRRFGGQLPTMEEVYEETHGTALNPDSYRKKIRRTLNRHHRECMRSTIRGHR